MKARYVLVCLMCPVALGCVPEHLKKYGTGSKSSRTSEPGSDVAASTPRTANDAANKRQERPSIYAIDEKTFRFSIQSEDIWDAAINVLLRNYNLTIVDKESGVVTTEWDTFFLDQDVYRNKVSLRIQRTSRTSSDVMIHNSVEKLSNGVNAGAVGSIWLPNQDTANEGHRIIRNMAILLNQPPPHIPGGNVATSGEKLNDSSLRE